MQAPEITRTRRIIRRRAKARPSVKLGVLHLIIVSHFEKIKDMILSKKGDETVIVRTENKIKRKRIDGGVHLISESEDKTYRVSFLKRRRLNDNTSLPFGYINAR